MNVQGRLGSRPDNEMDRELLIEIGVEELPAAWLPGLTRQVAERLEAQLRALRLAPLAPVESYSTPRRLTGSVARMAERQEDLDETISGPPVSAAVDKDGKPTPAALGFARKQGVAFAELARVTTPKGEYLAHHRRVRGRSAVDTIPDVVTGLLRDLAFPKQMHWDAMLDDGRGELLFGRPIRWLLLLYGGRVVPYTIGRAPGAATSLVQEIQSGALTYGHRFLTTSGRAGRSIKVRNFEEYQARLAEHYVVLSHDERRDRIARDLEMHATRLGGRVQLKEHATLIDEVADLVEYPGVVAGFYNPAFLELPHEVLTTTLVHHQHYFPVTTEGGALKEAFLAVVNTEPRDERLIAKNAERVVTARLRDARFFWDADRAMPFEGRLERLDTVAFHKRGGSFRDKALRIEQIARAIAAELFEARGLADAAAQAAVLAKADLTTQMVFEFPELQGVMGGIYAREQGLPEAVWRAIYHHYLPIGVEPDAPPTRRQLGEAAATWAALSLADKVDSLLMLTRAGEKATGSRDPFGLRRQAQGIVRVLLDLPELAGIDKEIQLGDLFQRASAGLPEGASPGGGEAVGECLAFAIERVRYALERRGIDPGVVRAVTAAGDVSPLRARRVAEALQGMRASADFQALAVLFKRVKNIAKELAAPVPVDRGALVEPAEQALLEALDARRPRVGAAVARRDYRAAFAEIAGLRAAVDRFFTEVFVMADDERLRHARLALMADLRNLVLDLADISEIVPQTE